MKNIFKKLFGQISVHDTEATSMPITKDTKITTFTLMHNNLPVGELQYDGSNWSFKYTKMFQKQSTIEAIPSFPKKDKMYSSSQLWPFFQARIPSLKQPKVIKKMKALKIKDNDVIALLKAFGAFSINNPFELRA